MRRLLAAVVLATAACEDHDPMQVQPRYNAYRESAFFDDRRAMRPLVPGTVAQEWRGRRRLDQPRLPGGEWRTAAPMPLTRELLLQGQSHYESYCAVCHGLTGAGDSMVARNMPLRRPPSLLAPHRHEVEVVYGQTEAEEPHGALAVARSAGLPPGALRAAVPLPDGGLGSLAEIAGSEGVDGGLGTGGAGRQLPEGRQGVASGMEAHTPGRLPHPSGFYYAVITEGFGMMPSYRVELSPEQRWAVVGWLQVLARSQAAPLEAAPPEVRERLLKEAP